MGLLLKAIFGEPIVLLGICFVIIGAASLLFKVFNITEPGNKYAKRNEKNKKENQNSKKAFVFILIAILIGLIVFIYWLGK
jgi:uncharacterized membrane protein